MSEPLESKGQENLYIKVDLPTYEGGWYIKGDPNQQDAPTYIMRDDGGKGVLVGQVFGGSGDRPRYAWLMANAPRLERQANDAEMELARLLDAVLVYARPRFNTLPMAIVEAIGRAQLHVDRMTTKLYVDKSTGERKDAVDELPDGVE